MSQKDRVLTHLKTRPITQRQAVDNFNCWRLADVIYKLRSQGHTIITETYGKSKYARYRLIS